jgi:ribosomal protein S27AE
MYPKYKKIKMLMPHCPQCGEVLSGDNSGISPWRCSCGEWHNSWSEPLDYKITPIKK